MAETKIVVEGLAKRFDLGRERVTALESVDLEVREGEFCAIVGPSGCGKSTLLRIVAGLERQDAGRITAYRRTDGGSPLTSMVFQEPSALPWMTVATNVAYGLRMRLAAPALIRTKSAYYLRATGLQEFAAAYPYQLSGGMKQRVSIARAFANDPEILLMDEPFASLDEQTKLVMQAELLGLWEETRKTVLYVTHSLDEAILLSDRVVIMTARPGRIKAVLTVEFPRPRAVASLKADPAFGRMYARLWDLLRDEVPGPHPAVGPAAGADAGRAASAGTGPAERQAVVMEPAPGPRRPHARRERLLFFASPLAALLAWELAAGAGLLDLRFFPPPSVVAGTFVELVRSGEWFAHVGATMGRVLAGFALGSTAGILVGIGMGLQPLARMLVYPWLASVYPIPKIAIFPLVLLVLGLGESSKVFTVALSCFFILAVNAMTAVLGIPRVYQEVGRNFGARGPRFFRTIALPAALPVVFAGLKLALGIAFLVVVSVEFVGADRGIGWLIWHSWDLLSIRLMFVGLLTVSLLGLVTTFLLEEVETWLIPWKQ